MASILTDYLILLLMLPVETYQDIIEFITTPECCKLICLSSILCDVLTRRIRLAKEKRWMCLRKAFMSIACDTDLALLMSLSVELRQLGHSDDAGNIETQVRFLDREISACLQTFGVNKQKIVIELQYGKNFIGNALPGYDLRMDEDEGEPTIDEMIGKVRKLIRVLGNSRFQTTAVLLEGRLEVIKENLDSVKHGVLAQARADAAQTHANNPVIPNPFVLARSSQSHPGSSAPNAGALPNDQPANRGTDGISAPLAKHARKDDKSGR
uniref:F-box domain-containing protein n=1 Tax=Ditylenchus dipsaci TaxID=166011 RepID=A0A915CQI6_9BILA